jgi:EAL domain-containing protein (putative c-di-GMP-specific phosphodiesterase class I)/GGDEF domain-containing protein
VFWSIVISISSHQARQALSYVVFAIVALASVVFWGVELRLSMASHDEREEEVLVAYQQRQLELKSEGIRDIVQELYQTGRMISLLPAIREVRGTNRHSVQDDVLKEGRLSLDSHRMLQQVYANLRAYVQVSEIYFILDGFQPDKGEVPFFMYDDLIVGHSRPGGGGTDVPDEDEHAEYEEIQRQLAWFGRNASTFTYGAQLNTIPALVSPLLQTCDVTQLGSKQDSHPRDGAGFVYSIPAYDAQSGKFKGQVSIIVRANVLEAKLLGVPFLPVTPADKERMMAEGWTMPAPSSFVLQEKSQKIEIADRRNLLLSKGLAAAQSESLPSGRWATMMLDLPSSGQWTLHHYLPESEVDALVGAIRTSKQMSIAGRLVLLVVLGALLGWGFWLMRASRRELLKMAHYDLLTDLPNRRLFFDRMENGMARAQRSGSKMGVFFVDIAGLNAVNDRHGHQGGDLLLVKVAKRLHQHLRETDGIFGGRCVDGQHDKASDFAPLNFMLSRLGGDEFTIVCDDLHSADDLIIVAERIIGCVRESFSLGDETVDITLNVGAALYPDDAQDAERLLMSADSAMHECKNTRSRYVLFNEAMRQRAERLHLLTVELLTALSKDQFELFYQPKATLLDGQVVSMEALIRWHHPTLGLVSPVEFIPILESNGAIVEVGEWIVEQACRDLHRLTAAGFADIRLSVNVSVRQLKRGNFYGFLKEAMASSRIDPTRLILEITETMVIDDLQKGREALLALKQLGVSLAIDDFGSGYSSLTYLQHLPLDSLKIDKSLIDGMVDERSIHVVASVIRLAQGLSLKTIAEGIETEAQRVLIGSLGCDLIQGYLLSRPLPLPSIIEWLNERQRLGIAKD